VKKAPRRQAYYWKRLGSDKKKWVKKAPRRQAYYWKRLGSFYSAIESCKPIETKIGKRNANRKK